MSAAPRPAYRWPSTARPACCTGYASAPPRTAAACRYWPPCAIRSRRWPSWRNASS
ncbi:hypothetical protein P4234_09625 [Pseudomonas aeruginosa]|nr:hypothetical protein [Pseudomonas aeruginosa]